MIKFEEHDGMIFRMLEEPVPLTPDAKMPCLVRLIQDDSPMGKYNQDMRKFALHAIEMCIRINSQNDINTSIANISGSSLHYARYEVIGYHVAEGSAEWALYQMMQGKKVRHKSYIMPKVHCAMNERGDVICYANDLLTSRQADAMINERTGWEIYEPEHEQPKYKVGDWVRGKSGYAYEITAYPSKLLPDNPNVYDAIPASCMDGQSLCLELSDIESKLSPSEVILDFGSGIKGWIRRTSNHTIEVYNKANCWLANIRYDMLDTETRELVESLLEAMRGEK